MNAINVTKGNGNRDNKFVKVSEVIKIIRKEERENYL